MCTEVSELWQCAFLNLLEVSPLPHSPPKTVPLSSEELHLKRRQSFLNPEKSRVGDRIRWCWLFRRLSCSPEHRWRVADLYVFIITWHGPEELKHIHPAQFWGCLQRPGGEGFTCSMDVCCKAILNNLTVLRCGGLILLNSSQMELRHIHQVWERFL